MRKLEIDATYKHYKGTKVKVLHEALHSETLEPMVVYIHLEDGGMWARPKNMFLESTLVNGRKTERFQKINQKTIIKPNKKK